MRYRNESALGSTGHLWDGDDLLMELDGAGAPVAEYTSYPSIDFRTASGAAPAPNAAHAANFDTPNGRALSV